MIPSLGRRPSRVFVSCKISAKMLSLSTALQVLSFSVFVQPAVSDVFESIYELPRGWKYDRDANGDESVKLRVSLKQQNLDSFYDKLMEVSTPDHPQYGQHYEGHELRSLLKPTDEASSIAIS